MEDGDNILHAIYDEDNLDDLDDDVEEGELVEHDSQSALGESSTGDINIANQESLSKNRKHRANKKSKRKRNGSGSNGVDMNSTHFPFPYPDVHPIPSLYQMHTQGTCSHLTERKSYMVYTAVGCLGVSAISDLIIEKQFRQLNIRQPSEQKKKDYLQEMPITFANGNEDSVSDGALIASHVQDQHSPSALEGTRSSVHDRLRIPVSYDDDLLVEGVKDDET